ncbi:hypothetical protein ACLVWQ_17700 (plasmid) [Streptomyces sp. CWNU-52B]|uniref:zinc finger domain-containing protein n=1 Tax=unclassified Streptomyces TaxID=2593676 RepID=UPI0039C21026
MTPDETVVLARYVRALCPQQKFDEYTPDAWHDVIGDYPLAAARAAAAAVARRQPFVSPAEIIDEITAQRSDAAVDIHGPGLPAEIPDADPDDVPAYLAAVRQQRTRAADGQHLKRRPVAALIASVKAALPSVDGSVAAVRRPGPLGIDCPQCKAAIGRPCKTPAVGGRAPREREPHVARRTAATGGPVADRATTRADEEHRRAHYLQQLAQMQEPAT